MTMTFKDFLDYVANCNESYDFRKLVISKSVNDKNSYNFKIDAKSIDELREKSKALESVDPQLLHRNVRKFSRHEEDWSYEVEYYVDLRTDEEYHLQDDPQLRKDRIVNWIEQHFKSQSFKVDVARIKECAGNTYIVDIRFMSESIISTNTLRTFASCIDTIGVLPPDKTIKAFVSIGSPKLISLSFLPTGDRSNAVLFLNPVN